MTAAWEDRYADLDEEARAAVENEVAEITEGWPGDPLARYTALTARQAYYQAVSEGLADARGAAVSEIKAGGDSVRDVAKLIVASPALVQKLLDRHRRREGEKASDGVA